MTSSMHSQSDNDETDEQQKQGHSDSQHQGPQNTNVQAGILTPSAEQVMFSGHLEAGHAVGQFVYPYVDPYYGGVFAAYGGQTMIHPQLMGMQNAGLPLPTDAVEEPVYVNAKQYHGILRRRQSRAKAETEKKLIKSRKPYLHESRHLHALKRARGCGGRFLNSKSEEDKKDLDSKSEGDEPRGSASDDNAQLSTYPTSGNACPGNQKNIEVSGERAEPLKCLVHEDAHS
ncbi:nuclear transcription factor Y subunit A-7-like [Typha angustifolia]|uniref:nuclear transcription factor Y subunit A-7-like n=1 Tax=Typha angustifolia TaxID=59011 RepID=UPI003C2C4E5D